MPTRCAPGPTFLSNHAGGILGGISTGQPVVVRVAFKPTSSILTPMQTIDRDGNETEIVDQRAARPVRRHPRRADRRSDDGARARRPEAASPGAVRLTRWRRSTSLWRERSYDILIEHGIARPRSRASGAARARSAGCWSSATRRCGPRSGRALPRALGDHRADSDPRPGRRGEQELGRAPGRRRRAACTQESSGATGSSPSVAE